MVIYYASTSGILIILGVTRLVFPSRVYGSPAVADKSSFYETARLFPRGDDGGFAEGFLRSARAARHTGDT